jgi:hypothetical protein
VIPIVQLTPTDLDDKALSIVEGVLNSSILYDIVWDKIHGIEPEPEKIKTTTFFERVKNRIKERVASLRGESVVVLNEEETATADAAAGSVLTVVWVFSLLLQTPQAIKNLSELMDFVRNRLGESEGEF